MIKNYIKSYTSIFSIFFLCFTLHSQTTVTDVSGNIYKTVKIGNQIWMAENLRTEKFNNGDPIEQISSNRFWQEITFKMMDDSSLEYSHPAMCYYNNTKLKDNVLYNWYAVVDNRDICPTGWHVPSSSEFFDLLDQLGGLENALNPLKDQTSWLTNGNNSSGFRAKGIGGRTSDGTFAGDSAITGYWTDTHSGERNEYNNLLMPYANLIYLNNDNIELGSGVYNLGSSIRCIKN
jgi:uncharacterized protein (TIGR02145 family)